MLIIGEIGRDGKGIYRRFTSFVFSYHSYCSWGSQGKNTEVIYHSLLQWTTYCQTSPPWPICLGQPHMAWLSFTELNKLWLVWSDWLVVCDCCFKNWRSNCQHSLDQQKKQEFQKNIYFCFTDYAKTFDCVDHNKLENSERDGNTRPPDLPLEKSVCRSGRNS